MAVPHEPYPNRLPSPSHPTVRVVFPHTAVRQSSSHTVAQVALCTRACHRQCRRAPSHTACYAESVAIRTPGLCFSGVKYLQNLLVLLGWVVEGSLPFPDVVCSVGSREVIRHSKLLRALVTEAQTRALSLSPSFQGDPGGTTNPQTSCRAVSDFDSALYTAVPRSHLGLGKSSRPATCNRPSVPPFIPGHL
jgi:hypothetical protein